MKIDHKTNFAGYFTIMRATLYLLKYKKLNLTQLSAYICFIAQADYDPRHKHYGVILRDDAEIARELGLDKTTVYKHRKTLIAKGILIEEKNYTKVPNFYLFELKWVKSIVKAPPRFLQRLIENPQREVEDLPELIEKIQQSQVQNNPQSFSVSSKSSLSSFTENLSDIDIPIDEELEKQ